MRILTVDDDPIAPGNAGRAESRGARGRTCPDGIQALEVPMPQLPAGYLRLGICRISTAWSLPPRSRPRFLRLRLYHSADQPRYPAGSGRRDVGRGRRFYLQAISPGRACWPASGPASGCWRWKPATWPFSRLAKLAESRDPETGAHLERVRRYSGRWPSNSAGMPQFENQIDDNYIELIYLTSPLHDIGKVGIPDSVLLKPGRLTAEEFDIMKTHARRRQARSTRPCCEYPGATS